MDQLPSPSEDFFGWMERTLSYHNHSEKHSSLASPSDICSPIRPFFLLIILYTQFALTFYIRMQATIPNGIRTTAPHQLALNRAVTNGGRTTPGVGFTNGESGFSSHRVRSRDNQSLLTDHYPYGSMYSGASLEANQHLFAELNYAANTYGQSSAPRGGINWPLSQSAFSDTLSGAGAGYGYDRDPRSVNWSRDQPSYADFLNPTFGYEQAIRNYMYGGEETSYSKYQLAGQDTLTMRNGSVSTYVGHNAISSGGDGSVYTYGGSSKDPHCSWTSGGNVYGTSRESSVVARPSKLEKSHCDSRKRKAEKSLSPPSSQLFLPDASEFFLDYTDVGTGSDVSSVHGSQRMDRAVLRVDGEVGVSNSVVSGNDCIAEAVSLTGPAVLVPSSEDRKPTRERKRLKIDTDLFRYPAPALATTTSATTASPTELTSATSSNSSANRNGKKFPCSYCTKMFNRPSSRNTHELVHTGEKPHQCSFPTCGKRFSVLSNLRRHLKIHRAPPKGKGTLLYAETLYRI